MNLAEFKRRAQQLPGYEGFFEGAAGTMIEHCQWYVTYHQNGDFVYFAKRIVVEKTAFGIYFHVADENGKPVKQQDGTTKYDRIAWCDDKHIIESFNRLSNDLKQAMIEYKKYTIEKDFEDDYIILDS